MCWCGVLTGEQGGGMQTAHQVLRMLKAHNVLAAAMPCGAECNALQGTRSCGVQQRANQASRRRLTN